MSTLNSNEEILLAEKLISLHPWSEMARFTRSGGEANSVAIRIARELLVEIKLLFVVIMDGMIGTYLQI